MHCCLTHLSLTGTAEWHFPSLPTTELPALSTHLSVIDTRLSQDAWDPAIILRQATIKQIVFISLTVSGTFVNCEVYMTGDDEFNLSKSIICQGWSSESV